MPIYEFYCPQCHAVYNFLSRKVDTASRPACPSCGRPKLEREVSLFAAPSGAAEGEGAADELPVDEGRMERAMEKLAGESEHLDENDPRQAARLMRKFSDMTGLRFAGGVEEAIGRMESGEDPEAIEAELGDKLGDGDPFVSPEKGKSGTGDAPRRVPLRHDPKLYEM